MRWQEGRKVGVFEQRDLEGVGAEGAARVVAALVEDVAVSRVKRAAVAGGGFDLGWVEHDPNITIIAFWTDVIDLNRPPLRSRRAFFRQSGFGAQKNGHHVVAVQAGYALISSEEESTSAILRCVK